MKRYTVSETHFPVPQVQVTVLEKIRTQVHAQPLLESPQGMILEAFENFQARSTMETLTPVIQAKTGDQEPIGHVSLGKMRKATSQETLQHRMTTSGIQMQPRLRSQSLTKAQKTVTHHSKQMTPPPSKKRTTTV